ncbi:YggS family pyridoxal phosphate-dependent enzyme [Brumimicrobium oceani]|uniref:Pyridoxal phosphate homeostasis protein n=1 Tax=Brumimicrobium oceani TaxID=2100725 RepID=A0A2U2XDK4_9FLAO|nr:YggS family pyridoxal phosphate-dependent enzyme [Brumimicrobium oceani]PWH85858.1 YggS family pyridoxal phosphate-dependent enzyme [Brumimicrobium oceani]
MSRHIIENLQTIHSRISNACEKSNRDISEVRLLLATKTVDSDKILFALEQGENLIGENKVQELTQKCTAIAQMNPEVHFIGHLQSNKIKEVLKWVTCIQSIDRYELAEKLYQRLKFEKKEIDIYVQVNTSYEESKFGVAPENALDLIKKVSKFNNIHIKGLMTIGLFSSEPEKVRKCFKLLKSIQEEATALQLPNVDLKELSMGMSGDLEIAIQEGATIIRVGTAIFGERIYPDSYYWNEGK